MKKLYPVLLFLVLTQVLPLEARRNKCVDDYTALVDLVAEPKKYLGKKINIKGNFYSFGSLVLGYKKAMRSSKDYVGLILARPDEAEIPLVELKLAAALKMFKEEDIDIKHDDKVSMRAKVFAVVLGEPWLDVEEIEVLKNG